MVKGTHQVAEGHHLNIGTEQGIIGEQNDNMGSCGRFLLEPIWGHGQVTNLSKK